MTDRSGVRGRRGVALPVALVGLVAMSLLVTTVLLTSTTESAISAAQANGARALYNAEGGLHEYLRQMGAGQLALDPLNPTTVQLPESGQRVRVTTALLHSVPDDAARPDRAWTRTYAMTAEPVTATAEVRGRAVVAMVRQRRPPPVPLEMNITSAITLGGDLRTNGNAFTVSGKDQCRASAGVEAVRAATDSKICPQGKCDSDDKMDNFEGVNDAGTAVTGRAAIEKSNMTRQQLADNVLSGRSLEEVIATVPPANKWGPRFTPAGQPLRVWDGVLNPGENLAVIDANKGIVDIEGGSGVVIIVNGNMRMKGNAVFDGIIIVEGNFTLSGNPTINGALVSLAMEGDNVLDLDESAVANGNITVQYDKCDVDAALQAFGDVASVQPPVFVGTTFAWFEVVR
jgi:hypothetical protein